MALTRHQRNTLTQYATPAWQTVAAADYRTVMGLVGESLLTYDHLTGKVKQPEAGDDYTFPYHVIVSHPSCRAGLREMEVGTETISSKRAMREAVLCEVQRWARHQRVEVAECTYEVIAHRHPPIMDEDD